MLKYSFYIIYLIFIIFFSYNKTTNSEEINFNLKKLADGVFFHNAILDEPNKKNQGLIANLGVIIGRDSILVIDAGSSKKLAEKFIKSIKNISVKPIRYLIITHRHFDHSYGIEAFKEINAKIYMSKEEFYYFKKDGPRIFKNLVENRGFYKTNINFKNIVEEDVFFLIHEQIIDLGDRKVLVKNFGIAHTKGDLIVYDYKTKTYFVGDLIFRGRAAAFSDANIVKWRKKINYFFKGSWNFIVPGHGKAIKKKNSLYDTSNWLKFLQDSIKRAIKNGDMISEIFEYEIPQTINHLKLIKPALREGLKRQIDILQE